MAKKGMGGKKAAAASKRLIAANYRTKRGMAHRPGGRRGY